MNRTEIEKTLNGDRAWLINAYAGLGHAELTGPVTPSEHDDSKMWSAKDHLVHLILIERLWNDMIRRHLAGEKDTLGFDKDSSGTPRTREQMMAAVHEWTEGWADEHRDDSLDEIVALGQSARSETLQLLSELSQEQLDDTIPGAPWADGIVGGIIEANAGHGRMHWNWVKEARAQMASATS
jgi:DinB superfamily